MQITLVQSEIEQALRTYVNNLINIKEGTQINIDLSAGRGADGFKATIDIVQLGDVVAPVVQTQKAETKPAAEEKPTKPEPKKDKVQTQQAEKKAEQTQTLTGAVAEAGSAQLAGEAQPEPENAAEPEVQAEAEAQVEQAAPRKSLFGGLSKPTNE